MIAKWMIDVAVCSICRGDVSYSSKTLRCLSCSQSLVFDDHGILLTSLPSCLGTEFHEEMPEGVMLRSLQHTEQHLAYWETKCYTQAISDWIRSIDLSRCIAVDIGCGDGRFTELLFEHGCERVIAADSNYKSLVALAKYAENTGFRENLFLMHSDVRALPIRKNSVDLVTSIGVLYYLNNDFEVGLKHVTSLLVDGGALIASEPDRYGCAIKSILFDGLDEFIDTVSTGQFIEVVSGKPYKFKSFTQDEIATFYSEYGFQIKYMHGISIFPSLLSIGRNQGIYSKDKIQSMLNELRNAFDICDASNSPSKHVIRFAVKSK